MYFGGDSDEQAFYDVSMSSGANHHLVSRGYQRNFTGADHRIAVLDCKSGLLLDRQRAIRSNFAQVDFNTTGLPGVEPSDWLEQAFASIERPVLNQIREVGPHNAGPQMRAAVANLFAIHLVRSESYREAHDRVMVEVRRESVPRIASTECAIALFTAEFGRAPLPGEIDEIAHRSLDADERSRKLLSESTARQHDKIAEMLNGFAIQIIWTEPPLPGFVLGDVPVIHANTQSGRYGFRDGLALGDADLVIGPLARRVAACFTVQRLGHMQLRTKKMVDLVNAVFWRGARSEVACHPDDVLATQQMARRIDRLPAHLLHGRASHAS